MGSGETSGSLSRRSPEVLTPFLSLVLTAAILLGLIGSSGVIDAFTLILVVLSLVFLAGAALVWRRSRAGYIVSIVMSVLFILLFSSSIQSGLSGFADLSTFLTVVIITPALVLAFVYSVLGLRIVWRKGAPIKPARAMPVSSTLALITAGFVIGAALIGVLANGAVLAIGKSSNAKADVTIVVGAANAGIAQPFSPGNITVKAGSTVTWVNKDTVTHTVTSTSVPSGSTSFDSGNLPYGNTFSVKFTVPGVYHYDCSIHPAMTGVVVVTS